MALTTDEILRLAALAKLDLKKSEIETLKNQLSSVIDYFEELKRVPTDNVLPTSQTTGLSDVLRADEIDPSRILSQDEATLGSDNTHNGAFVVPQTIDKDQ